MKPFKLPVVNRARALRITLATGGAVLLCGLSFFIYEVCFAPPGRLAREEVVRRVSRESPILYADGQHQVGSLFTGAHRKYVTLRDIPPLALKAVVAAEDQNFYQHHGVDVLATGKAFADGLIHMKFRRAGSTITQQTVKILFDDWEHSFRRKVQEALAAFKMERIYTKDQILEFYLNQFHVTSNGNGIGVAARYYFNKEVRDLDLVEMAFIAGAVKHPTKYNPFTKYTRENRAAAEAEAKGRKDYVVRRMEEEGFITKDEAAAARLLPVPFNRGEFRSGDVALVELVRAQLDRREILDAVGMEESDEFNQAGLRIVTTFDASMQAAAEAAVRRNLVRLELLLKGYEPEPSGKYRALTDLKEGEYFYGRVESVARDGSDPEIKVSFGGPTGTIAAESLRNVAAILSQASGQDQSASLKAVLRQLQQGSVVFIRVASYDPATRTAVLELARRPSVNGGLVVLDEGEVRAAVPGFDPQGYDRAMQGQRQPGSVFKSIVFHAALQLGWSILDPMSNVRQNFPYLGRVYIPRGDHVSSFDQVSMLWTGVESENIAAVWLTAHLLDKVSFEEFKSVLDRVGLAPSADETQKDYYQRISLLTGVHLNDDGVEERQLGLAAAEMIPSAASTGEQRAVKRLRSLWWGRGYEAELERLGRRKRGSSVTESEQSARTALIANNYRRLLATGLRARSDWNNLTVAVQKYGVPTARRQPSLQAMLQRFVLVPGPDGRLDIAYLGDEAAHAATADLITRHFNDADIERVFGGGLKAFLGLADSVNDVRLDGWLTVAKLEKLRDAVVARTAAAKVTTDDKGVSLLFQHHDFRIATGLRYLVKFTQAAGVTSRVEPVLSFALGTNAVTLAEVAKVYQTMLSGRVYRFFDEGPANQLNMIARIEDEDGNVLYEASKKIEQLVSPEPSRPFLEILRRVVTNGTGRALDKALVASTASQIELKIPAFGKTGTTNDFTSGSFAGFLPYPDASSRAFNPLSSYVIAAYAGFDRNQKMQRGHFRGYGADVALPAWTELAQGIVRSDTYADRLSGFDTSGVESGEWPLVTSGSGTQLRVDLISGNPVFDAASSESALVRVPGSLNGRDFVAKRGLKFFKVEPPDASRTERTTREESPTH